MVQRRPPFCKTKLYDIIIRQVQQMKNYSFSGLSTQDNTNIRKSTELSHCYRHSELKAKEANQRIEEIKRKYDTPSRRERIDSLKKSQHFGGNNRTPHAQDSKQNVSISKDRSMQALDKYMHHPAPTFGNNPLKESFAVNRLEKSALRNDVDRRQLESLHRNEKDSRAPLEERGMNVMELKSHAREGEEALLSKMREMKESLINNDMMKGSLNGRSSTTSFKYNPVGETKNQPNRQFDPRVQNIDKINSKIKQILSCLAENEKHPSKYMKEKDSPQQSYQKEEPRASTTLHSHVFRERNFKDESVRNSYMHTEVDRNSKIFAPVSSIPSDRNVNSSFVGGQQPIEESNVYNFYKHNDSKNQNLDNRSVVEESRTNPTEDHKYKGSADVKAPYEADRSRRQYSVSRAEGSSSKLFKRKEEYPRTPSYIQTKQFDPKTGMKVSRSRSQAEGISKSALTDTDKDTLKSGKKLNEEISRIQSRIEEMEKQKTKLNINFTPFSQKNRSASVLGHTLQPSSVDSHKKPESQHGDSRPIVPHFRSSSSSTKERHLTAHFGNYKETEQDVSCSMAEEASRNFSEEQSGVMSSVNGNFRLSLGQVDVDVKTVRIDKPADINEEASINRQEEEYSLPTLGKDVSFAYNDVKKRTDDGILERKKRLNHQELIKTDTLKKLVQLFCEQAKHDEHLRNQKFWFEEYSDKDKFQTLAHAITQKGIKMNAKECSAIFKVEESEHNPFFTVQGYEGSIQAVAKAYLEANNHWNNQIRRMFDRESLLAQGFTKNKIDLERKGFIELQDLVRLLNIESGTFYRNRDIFLIFRRLTTIDRTTFQELLKEISA